MKPHSVSKLALRGCPWITPRTMRLLGPSWYKSEHLLCWSHKGLRVCELRAKTTEGRDWVSVGELLDRCGDSKDDPATSSMVSPWVAKGTHGLTCGTLIVSHDAGHQLVISRCQTCPISHCTATQNSPFSIFSLCFSGWLLCLG